MQNGRVVGFIKLNPNVSEANLWDLVNESFHSAGGKLSDECSLAIPGGAYDFVVIGELPDWTKLPQLSISLRRSGHEVYLFPAIPIAEYMTTLNRFGGVSREAAETTVSREKVTART